MNIHILGDRTAFLSKNAIVRLKNDVKVNPLVQLDEKKYLQDGFGFKIDTLENNVHVNIITRANISVAPNVAPKVSQKVAPTVSSTEINPGSAADLEKEAHRLELRKKLRARLADARKESPGEIKKKLESLKRSVPPKIYDSYVNLMTKYKLDHIPAPDEVINNVEKYKIQISAVMGKMGKISNDPKVSTAIRHYFTTLGDFLGIEAMSADMVKEVETQFANMTAPAAVQQSTKVNDDDTDEEED
jgi:hypothetical protein